MCMEQTKLGVEDIKGTREAHRASDSVTQPREELCNGIAQMGLCGARIPIPA